MHEKFRIYKELRRHQLLAKLRNINVNQDKAAKAVLWITYIFIVMYLIAIAIILAMANINDASQSPSELLFSCCPFILFIDFVSRFSIQQIPSQLVKPYLLLPLPRHAYINYFIINSLLSYRNLIWFALIIPYTLMSTIYNDSFQATTIIIWVFQLLILANCQWYIIVKTLINYSTIFWTIPIIFYTILFLPYFIGDKTNMENLLEFYARIGTLVDQNNPIPVICSVILLIILVNINKRLLDTSIMKEIYASEYTPTYRLTNIKFFDKYGEIGKFIQLEIKTIIRNKNPRRGIISGMLNVFILSVIITFGNIYTSTYMTNYWCLYCFTLFGVITLSRIMCLEGNYIDGLIVRKENILNIFHVKYRLYSLGLILPLILMLPTIYYGKWSIWMLVSYMLFTAGFQYFIIFQLAIYNKQTIPLNTKVISKNGSNNNTFSVVTIMILFFIPTIIASILEKIIGKSASYMIMSSIGICFILTHPIWLKNIYNRFMKRRYSNLEAFRKTR